MNPNKMPKYSEDFRQAIYRVLSFIMPKEQAYESMDKLLSACGDISLLTNSGIEALAEMDGMNMNSAVLFKLLTGAFSRMMTEGFRFGVRHSDEEIESYLKGVFIGLEYETVFMLILDSRERVICCERISEGSVCASEIHPRRMLEIALRRSAHSVIIAHNHPRGVAEPSADDSYATWRIMQVLRSAGIILRGHYAVSGASIERVPLPKEFM